MKWIPFICLFSLPLTLLAQEDSTYEGLKNSVSEIKLTDSISINNTDWELNRLDSNSMRRWFAPILPTTPNNRLKNRDYYLAGKITASNNFDLLILIEEKKKDDTTKSQVAYLVTHKKDGTYIASLEIGLTGTKKKSSFVTSSWLYKDYKIVQDSKITVNQRSYADLKKYKISNSGRFILSANY